MAQQPHNPDSGIKPEAQPEARKPASPTASEGPLNAAQTNTPEPETVAKSETSDGSLRVPSGSLPKSNMTVTLGPEEQFPVAHRMPLQVFVEETRGQKLSHWGPTGTAFLSFVLGAIVGGSAILLNRQQIALQRQQIALDEKQTTLQTEQVKAQLADMRFKFLNDLTDKDENKKIPAEIGLAGHGLDALPVVHFALGVEQGEIRDSAVNVVYRMFQAASVDSRSRILDGLMREFDSPNKLLHTGIVQSLVKIQPLLNTAEFELVVKTLNARFPAETVCSYEEGRNVTKQVSTFFPVKESSSIPQLMKIVRFPRCGDGWLQAMVRLEDAAAASPKAKRQELVTELQRIEVEALNTLRGSVTDEDLESGGFQEFIVAGQVSVKFNEFKHRVILEFKRLRDFLSQE